MDTADLSMAKSGFSVTLQFMHPARHSATPHAACRQVAITIFQNDVKALPSQGLGRVVSGLLDRLMRINLIMSAWLGIAWLNPFLQAQVMPVEGGNMPKAAELTGGAAASDAGAATYVIPKETKEQKDARMKWFRDARYGMFIHWGPSSILGTETSWGRKAKRTMDCGPDAAPNGRDEVYDNLYKQFNPVKFNVDEWVKIAKDAGMKYIVFTCKHHDGFNNFHTKYTDYNIANTPFKRDIVKELADACHKAGMRFGVYYSPRDWYQPDYLVDGNKKYLELFHGHLQELLNNYGKVDIIWFDSMGGDWADWDYPKMAEIILKSQPDILSNGRIGVLQPRTKRADYDLNRLNDFQTPEQAIGGFQRNAYWESCTCLVDGQWGYKPDGLLLTKRDVLGMVLYATGGDGNLLLDVAPTPLGNFEERQIKRLKEVGDWLKDYGETIYGTRGGPYKPGYWGVCTLKGDKIFLHCLNFQGDTLVLPALGRKVLASRVLTGGKVKVAQDEKALTVTLNPKYQREYDTIVELTIDGQAFDIKPITVTGSGSLLTRFSEHQNRGKVQVKGNAPAKHWWANPCRAHQMFDDCGLTCWRPDPGTTEASVTLDLEDLATFNEALMDCDGQLDSLEVAVKDGQIWKLIGTFKKPGKQQKLQFPATTAQVIKLTFKTSSPDMFRVWEFQLNGKTKFGNRARGKTAYASSSHEAYPAEKAVDGEFGSFWSTAGGGQPAWITVDLGESMPVEMVLLYPRNVSDKVGYAFPVDFSIQVSEDNQKWIPVVTKTEYTCTDKNKGADRKIPADTVQCFPLPAVVNARYVKIEATKLKDGNQMQFQEIEVFGSKDKLTQ